jgi:hypothetical protein
MAKPTKLELIKLLTGVRLEITEDQAESQSMDELVAMAGGVPEITAITISDGDERK